jgi:hypothetical protein
MNHCPDIRQADRCRLKANIELLAQLHGDLRKFLFVNADESKAASPIIS